MEKRQIAGTDLYASPIALGTVTWGSDTIGDDLQRLVDVYAAAGGNFFDTAHCYAFWRKALGKSEQALGKIVRERYRREDAVVATKCGHPDAGWSYRRPKDYLSARQIARDVSESIDRLGLDSIDLLFAHRDDPRVPVGELMEALNGPVKAGQARYLGASNWSAGRIAEANAYAAAHGLAGFVASQPQWSLARPSVSGPGWDPTMRTVTDDDRAWYREAGLPLMVYTSTARGYFADGVNAEGGTFDSPESRERRERARKLAAQLGTTADAIALAWLLGQPHPVTPIVGTRDPEHLAAVLAAAEVTLSAEQLAWLEAGDR